MTQHPCVYALRHRPTGHIYIGSTTSLPRRLERWKKAFRDGEAPPRLQVLGPFEDWEAHVLRELPGATPSELGREEATALARAVAKAPDRVMNTLAVQRADAAGLEVLGRVQTISAWARETGVNRVTITTRLRAGWTPEQATGLAPRPNETKRDELRASGLARMATRIVDADGTPLLVTEAAERLGVRRDNLVERLRHHRVKYGMKEVTLEALRRPLR